MGTSSNDLDLLHRLEPTESWLADLVAQGGEIVRSGPFITVIGPDVNLTSRIERLCRELDRVLIISEACAAHLERPVWEIGSFELRGLQKMQRLFELPHEEN